MKTTWLTNYIFSPFWNPSRAAPCGSIIVYRILVPINTKIDRSSNYGIVIGRIGNFGMRREVVLYHEYGIS